MVLEFVLMYLIAVAYQELNRAEPDRGNTTFFGIGGVFVVGIGARLLGALLMLVFSRIDPSFFQGPPRRCGRDRRSARLGPDATVMSPDLSNLPPGRDPYVPPDPRNPPD